jgi:hypothetical protein
VFFCRKRQPRGKHLGQSGTLAHNGTRYTLSGTISFRINLDIGMIEPFIELP